MIVLGLLKSKWMRLIMPRSYSRNSRDKNEPAIIQALVAVGATVQQADFCDLVVGFRGQNYLIEVKNPEGKNKIEESQAKLLETWRGQYEIVKTADEALRVIGVNTRHGCNHGMLWSS